ncbi:MAG: hypothetical protein ISQ14_10570 [Verrucomicrobiae bacterium]|nr:hypothetical protein [Verrucomicrobiae bacterium]
MPLGELANWLFGGDEANDPSPGGPRLGGEGKPTIELPGNADLEIQRVEKLTRDPLTRSAYAGFIRALYRLVGERDLSPENLSRLIAGLDCKHKPLRKAVGAQLMNLSHHFEELTPAFLKVLKEGRDERRTQLVKAVWQPFPPRATAIEMLRVALDDRSEQVRFHAVDRIRTGEYRELIPDVRKLRQRESSAKLLRSIDFNLGLLETGFYVEQNTENDSHVITIHLGKGGVSSKSIPSADYSPEKVKQVLESLRADWRRIQGDRA